MVVTTALRTTEQLDQYAIDIANELELPFLPRNKRKLSKVRELVDGNLLVVGKEQLKLYYNDVDEPFFFHPNTAMFRIKRLIRGEQDPLIEVCQLKKGMSFLDCTLGMASDSMVASAAVTESGKVLGLEAENLIAFIIKNGLKRWDAKNVHINSAMRHIEVIQTNHEDYLHTFPSNSFDIVYFDPMFEEEIDSVGIAPLKSIVQKSPLCKGSIEEAKRIAKKRVVLKDHFRSKRFEEFGFHIIKRPTSKFHYGYIDV
ncbi:class I SAM-dependent methyltransferase [Bacillus sp. FJAT-45350]|uniref:class I SAM-dependent methyltransferase n=1 Tax=Bacillus sp. FJAT-45350 TaxID=2011014 RepID=UPI0011550D0B|nr:class I SAM-dependent methyltransferase [Bacillus sp. FJAT-45350]